MKLWGFILKNSRILEVSPSSFQAPLCCPTWLVKTWLSILIASLNSKLETSPCGCMSGALCNLGTSIFLLAARSHNAFCGGMIIWKRVHTWVWKKLLEMNSNKRKKYERSEVFLICHSLLSIDVSSFTTITRTLYTLLHRLSMTLKLYILVPSLSCPEPTP